MNQRDIGELLSMGTGSAVCWQLKRFRDRRSRGSDFDACIEKIESALARVKESSGKHQMSIVKWLLKNDQFYRLF